MKDAPLSMSDIEQKALRAKKRLFDSVNDIQYCAKVMRTKCANFVLCLRELRRKFAQKFERLFAMS